MSKMTRALCLGAVMTCFVSGSANAVPYFYVGAAGGDFFDENNWNDAADGTGASPGAGTIDPGTTSAIGLDLVIDGDTVDAAGDVDFGPGSLTLGSGSSLSVTGAGSDLDINAASSFSLTNATLTVDDVVNFEGTSTFSGGSVTSTTDDVAFQDNISLSIDGTTFNAGDNIYFDGFSGTVSNAAFTSADRLGVRNNVDVVMSDTSLTVQGGQGDIDDVFAAAGAGSSLTLLGASVLLADSVEEGADLILGGTTSATMGGQGVRIVADGSTITLTTEDVLLIVQLLDDLLPDYVDPRPFLINGFTGLSYAADPFGWNVTNWNGIDAVTLQVLRDPQSVPEPGVLAAVLPAFAVLAFGRRRRKASVLR